MDSLTPYEAKEVVEAEDSIDDATRKTIEAIIKDANQLVVVLVMCLCLTMLGTLVVMPWYSFRLWQWYSLAGRHPSLMVYRPPLGSFADQFQRAKANLWSGLFIGFAFLGLITTTVAGVVLTLASAQGR
ncbi:MAG: hypothetical protein KDA83_10225 [Planctomycetales bacterium]|nr:hypothetical protein [Planctomycetales bacterium]